jgi:2-polyprenyl-3-methyl-5-hydroxy-6-metoxy-1,4-benzoquinol methylase
MLSDEMCSAIAAHYPGAGRFTRFHLKVRLHRCPYDMIAGRLPGSGSCLDIGCGFGHFAWYLFESGCPLRCTGIDVDPHKITVARSTRAGLCGVPGKTPPDFLLGTPGSLGLHGQYDAITIIDVLYLLPWPMQAGLLEWCFTHLSKTADAVCVVKNPDTNAGVRLFRPYLQEWIMVRLLRKTRSSGTIRGGQPVETYRRLADSRGKRLDVVRMSEADLLLEFRHPQFISARDEKPEYP